MNRKEFQHLTKNELVGIICELMKDEAENPLKDLSFSDVEAVRTDLAARADRN